MCVRQQLFLDIALLSGIPDGGYTAMVENTAKAVEGAAECGRQGSLNALADNYARWIPITSYTSGRAALPAASALS